MRDGEPVCSTCNDSHKMWMSDLERYVMCTRCPTPCRGCGKGGPYCTQTPCPCICHVSGLDADTTAIICQLADRGISSAQVQRELRRIYADRVQNGGEHAG